MLLVLQLQLGFTGEVGVIVCASITDVCVCACACMCTDKLEWLVQLVVGQMQQVRSFVVLGFQVTSYCCLTNRPSSGL
jgi:hypothetical protein